MPSQWSVHRVNGRQFASRLASALRVTAVFSRTCDFRIRREYLTRSRPQALLIPTLRYPFDRLHQPRSHYAIRRSYAARRTISATHRAAHQSEPYKVPKLAVGPQQDHLSYVRPICISLPLASPDAAARCGSAHETPSPSDQGAVSQRSRSNRAPQSIATV